MRRQHIIKLRETSLTVGLSKEKAPFEAYKMLKMVLHPNGYVHRCS